VKRRGRPAPGSAAARSAPPPAAPGAPFVPPAVAAAIRTACLASPFAAAAALAWSLRGAPLGTPAADDFEFVSRVVFHRPLDWLGSMGATYYWRPLSRQVWFSLVTPLLLAAPAAVAAIHLALLGAIAFVLARLARRVTDNAGAALVAAAVIAAEPARTLVTWPSGIQHLLAALALALAAHETLAGRRWTAALAAVAAALSHELGVLAFVLVALGGVLRGARGRAALPDALLGAVLAAAWAVGYRAALAHGVQLPAGGLARAPGNWFEALRLGLVAAFNAEALPALFARPAATASGVLFAISLALLFRPSRRRDLDATGPLLGATLALSWAALLPLGGLLPDWNAWRAFVPVLALVFATTLTGVRAHAALGLALVAIRVAALAGAEPASRVTDLAPPGVSDFSFARLTRVQRTLAGSEPYVRAGDFTRDRRVAYWGLPTMTLNGFAGGLAAKVWARDSNVTFGSFEGRDVIQYPPAVVLSYDTRAGHGPVVPVRPEALALFSRGIDATDSNRTEEARAYYLRALAAQKPESPSLSSQLLHNLTLYEAAAQHYERADSLNRAAAAIRGVTPDGLALDALIALGRGDLSRAGRMLNGCLRLDPANRIGNYVRVEYERIARERAAQDPRAGASAAPPAGGRPAR
jgi:hypothetical protein